MHIKTIIADDEFFIRKHIEKILEEYADSIQIVEMFADGADIIEYLYLHKVDLLIMDIQMVSVSGIDVAKYIYEQNLPSKIILVSGHQTFEYARSALRFGVSDYISKPIEKEQLLSAIQSIFPLESRYKRPHAYTPSQAILIKKVKQIVEKDFSNPDLGIAFIAKKLNLTPTYLGSLYKKSEGESIVTYITKYRLHIAKEYLQKSDKKVSDIAGACGYHDTFYFSKKYKEIYGYPPTMEKNQTYSQ